MKKWVAKHPWRTLLAGFLAMALSWIVFLALSIVHFAGKSDSQPADAAIVLGAAVARGVATPVFEERIRHAINLYRLRVVRVLILTGGVGGGDTLAESEVARAYCLTHGVSADDIAIETNSHSTEENLVQARRLITERRLNRVLIVSDPLHERRAITIARDLGLDAYPSPTPTSKYVGVRSQGRFLAREVYFYGRYLLYRTFGRKA